MKGLVDCSTRETANQLPLAERPRRIDFRLRQWDVHRFSTIETRGETGIAPDEEGMPNPTVTKDATERVKPIGVRATKKIATGSRHVVPSNPSPCQRGLLEELLRITKKNTRCFLQAAIHISVADETSTRRSKTILHLPTQL